MCVTWMSEIKSQHLPQSVGLIRHFVVERGLPSGWPSCHDLILWREEYETSPVIPCPVSLGSTPWERCYSSPSPRALETAHTIWHSAPQVCDHLREADFIPFATGSLRLPLAVWEWMIRLAWATGHASQRAARTDMMERVQKFVCLLSESRTQHVLVVSHTGTMLHLRRALHKLGYRVPHFVRPRHGQLYLCTLPR